MKPLSALLNPKADKIAREKRTVELMIGIYCRHHHGSALCPQCADLLDYAKKRLDYCPKGNAKTSCRKCTTHCYAPAQRNKIRAVMRYSGPRLSLYSPIAAIRHLLTEI